MACYNGCYQSNCYNSAIEPVVQTYSLKKVFLEIHEIHRKTPAPEPNACNFIKKGTLAQVFSLRFCEISKNTFFYRTHLVAACAIQQHMNNICIFNSSILNNFLILQALLICTKIFRKLSRKFIMFFILFIRKTFAHVTTLTKYVLKGLRTFAFPYKKLLITISVVCTESS